MAHRRAKLTVFGRQLLVDRIELEGMSVALAAEMSGVSRQTASKWLRRYREAGPGGLEDGSSRPHRSPRALDEAEAVLLFADERVLSSDENLWETWAREAVEAEAYSRRLGKRVREGYAVKVENFNKQGGGLLLGQG